MKRKINEILPSLKKCKIISDNDTGTSGPALNFLSGVICYIHPAKFGTRRLNILQSHVKKHGGRIIQVLTLSPETISHIIFEESVDAEMLKQLINPSSYYNACFVRCTWLVECLKKKAKVRCKDHEIISVLNRVDKQESDEVKNQIAEPQQLKSKDKLLLTEVGGHEVLSTKMCVTNISPLKFSPNSFDGCQDGDRVLKDENIVPAASQLNQKCDNEEYNEDLTLGEVKTDEQTQIPSMLERQKEIRAEQVGDHEVIKSLLKPFPKKLQEKFACARPSSSKVKDLNSHITTELEKLAAAYKSKKDTWRALGYQKAISAIRNHPKEITSREEALRIHGVGESLADKVAEIVESGKLRKVSEVCEGEEADTLKLFMGVWGAGPSTAQSWYTQGFRTLEDLCWKATLTRHQKIGLKHYDDINSRIPRDEVAEIEEYVCSTSLSIKKGLIVMVCGSYRRGKPNCGDVDVLITHPDGHSHENIFKPLLSRLKETGFITDDLVTQEDNGNQQKYLGVCRLPGEGRKHRRLDVIVVPYAEFAPATMYFTGSAHFNRSMRLLATKMGMSLSEHGLRAGIVRQGREKLTDGHLIETPTEESIFEQLGLQYRPPEERDH